MTTVSVVIPTYNGARYIGRALDSVLAQSYHDYEIIVVDDGSTDHTREVLKPYDGRIKYIYQDNQTLPVARNTGVAAASGEYVAFLDCDDMFLPAKLEIQTRYLISHGNVGLVASGFQYIDQDDSVIGEHVPAVTDSSISIESLLFGGLAPVHAVLLRRCWLDAVGGFDAGYAFCEDVNLWYRLALAGCPMMREQTIVCQYRLHSSNMTRSPAQHFRYSRRALKEALDDPRMPSELRSKESQLMAQRYLAEATRHLRGQWLDQAHRCVDRALELDPELLSRNGLGLAELAVGLQSDVWGDGGFAELLIHKLMDVLPRFRNTVETVAAKKRFYDAAFNHDASTVRTAWMEVARRDPSWLVNRGAWSLLRRGFGHRVVPEATVTH